MVEDDPGHATLVRRNLKRAGVANEVLWAKDGQEALDYIHREGAHAGKERAESLVVLLESTCRAWMGSKYCVSSRPTTERGLYP